MEINGQLHDPAALPSEKYFTVSIAEAAGWSGFTEKKQIFASTGRQNPIPESSNL